MLVTGTIPGSSASENGLVANDQITAINGKPVTYYSMDEIDDLIYGKTAHEISIEVRRHEERLVKKIVMKELI